MTKLINHIGQLQNLKHLSFSPYAYYYEESNLTQQIINLISNLKGLRTLNINPAL